MVAWIGETFYWTATVIAGLLLAWVLWSYGFNEAEGRRVILIIPLVLAAIIWLTGWACRKARSNRTLRSLDRPGRREAARRHREPSIERATKQMPARALANPAFRVSLNPVASQNVHRPQSDGFKVLA